MTTPIRKAAQGYLVHARDGTSYLVCCRCSANLPDYAPTVLGGSAVVVSDVLQAIDLHEWMHQTSEAYRIPVSRLLGWRSRGASSKLVPGSEPTST